MPTEFHGRLLSHEEVAQLMRDRNPDGREIQADRGAVTKAMYRADIAPVDGWPEADVLEWLAYRELPHQFKVHTSFAEWRTGHDNRRENDVQNSA